MSLTKLPFSNKYVLQIRMPAFNYFRSPFLLSKDLRSQSKDRSSRLGAEIHVLLLVEFIVIRLGILATIKEKQVPKSMSPVIPLFFTEILYPLARV